MDEPEMIFAVKDIVEHEDGSATVTFDFDEKTSKTLIQYAIVDILTKAARQTKEEQREVHPDC